ncbi:hypothetical protein SK128_019625 [Halocaridina rubra]|uniref:Cadherin domain-containing protein n=1 Tax=Halocaridina rubra TaxID=373956 RepID=A0AAN8WGQ4_HALRR
MGSPSLNSTSTITVVVVDADDLPPVFTQHHYTAKISENPGPDNGVIIRKEIDVHPERVHAIDGDAGQNTSLRYSLVDSPAAQYFTLEPESGRLYLTRHLDRENLTDSTLILHIRAEQMNNPRRVGSSVIEIEVEDVNDNLPSFTHDVYAISIVENLPSGFSVVQVSASDPDEGLNGAFNYHVVGGNGALTVNPLSGWLTVANHNILDREESPVINLHVCANQITPLAVIPGPRTVKRQQDLPPDTPTQAEHETSAQQEPDSEPPSRSFRRRILKSVRPLRTDDPATQEGSAETWKEIIENIEARRNLNHGTAATVPLLRRVVQPTSQPDQAVKSVLARSRRAHRHTLFKGKILSSKSAGFTFSKTATESSEGLTKKTTQNSKILDPSRFKSQRVRRESIPSRIVLIRRRKSQELDPEEGSGNVRNESKIHLPENESLSCAKIELKLLDANDNNPVFIPSNQYHLTITRETQEGDIIGKVEAKDLDDGGNGQVTYRMQIQGKNSQDSTEGSFSVDGLSGNLTLTSKLPSGHFTFFIEASDAPINPSETRTSLAVVNIQVESSLTAAEVSDEPRFVGAPYELWVGSDAPVGTSIGQVRVADMSGSEVVFDLFHSYEEGVPFAIEETSGIVSVMRPIQEFSKTVYDFEVVVTDGKYSLVTNLTVHVAPSAVSTPVTNRRNTIINFTIQENLSGGLVGDVMLALRNMGIRIAPDPQFELVSPEARRYFALAQDATLYTVAPLDYETHPNHTLVIVSARTSDIFYVNVQVEDVNDNPPQLNAVSYEGLIRENALPGTIVRLLPTIQVSDGDKYPGSGYTLHLSGNDANIFAIDSLDATIKFVGDSLDREITDAYYLQLEARDDGNLTSKANLTISVEDINDNSPKFTAKEHLFSSRIGEENSSRKLPDTSNLEFLATLERNLIQIPESLPIGSRVTKVTATDEDAALFAEIHYGIESQRAFEFSSMEHKSPPLSKEGRKFSIESKTGAVVVTGALEPDHFYILNVSATDGGGLSSYTTVAIAVLDVNDHRPRFERPVYNFEVAEGEYLVGEVGKVSAFDQDFGKNAEIRYQIIFFKNTTQDQSFPFRIVETSGTILATGTVDREMQEVYEFTVIATDMGDPELSSSALIHIDVTDVNDHAPVFYGYQETVALPLDADTSGSSQEITYNPVYTAVISENIPQNTVIANVYTNDSDSSKSGNGIILYTLEGGGDKFAINSKNGSIYTVGSLDYERWPTHNLTVIAQDLGSPPLKAVAILSITVVDVEEELTSRLFDREEYQVEVEENNNTPLHLLDLNISSAFSSQKLTYQLVDLDLSNMVAVDAITGQVYLTASLDREKKEFYKFKVKATHPEPGRSLDLHPHQEENQHLLEYEFLKASASRHTSLDVTDLENITAGQESPQGFLRVPAEVIPLLSSGTNRRGRNRLSNNTLPLEQSQAFTGTSSKAPENKNVILGMDEVWISLTVLDQNDNTPKFIPHGRPIVAGVPSSAAYGHFVTRIMLGFISPPAYSVICTALKLLDVNKAEDPDVGINSEIRYEILPSEGSQDATTRFAVDPESGQVVVVGSLTEETGRMFGFDVRVSDQKGAPTGRTAITNVFVHVLSPDRHLVVEVGASPRDVEPHLNHIQG